MTTKDFLLNREKETLELILITNEEFNPLSADLFNSKPSDKKWSIGECFEHLNLTLDFYIPKMETIIKNKKRYMGHNEYFSYGLLGRMAVTAMLPKSNKRIPYKMKTFRKLKPQQSQANKQHVIRKFLSYQKSTLDIIQELKEVNMKKPKITTVAGPMLKMRIGDALHFMIAHNQRHIVQAQQVYKIIH